MILEVEIKDLLKLDYIDIKQALEDKPFKQRQLHSNYILRAFIKSVRANKEQIFNNDSKVDFICNGYNQVKTIINNGKEYTFIEVLKKLTLLKK